MQVDWRRNWAVPRAGGTQTTSTAGEGQEVKSLLVVSWLVPKLDNSCRNQGCDYLDIKSSLFLLLLLFDLIL